MKISVFVVEDEAVRWIKVLGACGLPCGLSYLDAFVVVVKQEAERSQRKAIEKKCGNSTVDGGAAQIYICSNLIKQNRRKNMSPFFVLVG